MPEEKKKKETVVLLVKSYMVKSMLSAFLQQSGHETFETINAIDTIHHIAKHGIPDSFIVCDAVGSQKEAVRLLMNIQKVTKAKQIPSVVILTNNTYYFEKINLPEYIQGVKNLPSVLKLKDSIVEAHDLAKTHCIEDSSGEVVNNQIQKALGKSDLVTNLDKVLRMFDNVVSRVANNDLPGPIMPGLMQEVRAISADPDISFTKLGDFIRKHQSLAVKILATSNSALYSTGTKVETVEQAVSQLGLKMTNSLMQSVAALEYIVGNDEEVQELIKENLRKAYLVALISQIVCEVYKYSGADKAFSLSLFHNLGATFLFYTFALLLEKNEIDTMDIESLRTVADKTTPRLNKILCEKLKLPIEMAYIHNTNTCPIGSEILIKVIHKSLYLTDAILAGSEEIELNEEGEMLGLDNSFINTFNPKIPDLKALLKEYV